MFAKLLKHDFRAVRELLGLLCLICLGCGVLGGGALRVLDGSRESSLLLVLGTLIMTGAFLGLIVSGIAMQFLTLAHFYKSRFTDQGYLTFTLPVSGHVNLLSAYVNCLIGNAVGVAAVAAGFAILILFGLRELDGRRLETMGQFAEACANGISILGLRNAALLGVYMLVGNLSNLLLIMLAIVTGSVIAKKHKILAAVGVYYGVTSISSFGVLAVGVSSELALVGGENASFAGILMPQILLWLLIGVGSYLIMHWLVSRKLNLN